MKRCIGWGWVLGCLIGMCRIAPAQGFVEQVITDQVSNAFGVCAADFDGDGDMDAGAIGSTSGIIVWIENTGSSAIVHQVAAVSGSGPRGITAGDFDGDGDADIVVAAFGENRFLLLRNTGGGVENRFHVEDLQDSCNGAWSVRSGDMDDDGDLDLVTTEYTGYVVRVFEQVNGQLVARGGARAEGPMDARFADFNGDGVMDVVGCSNFAPLFWLERNANQWYLHSLGSGANCTAVAAADLDGDQQMELATSPFAATNAYWWDTTPDSLVSHQLPGYMYHPRDVGIADFDMDRDPDIVATAQGGQGFWWRNLGNETFERRDLPQETSLYGLCIVDWDQDGDPDILAADYEAGRIILYRNTMGIPAVLAGTVRAVRDGSPVAGARVRLVEINSATTTNADGQFRIGAAAGPYTVQVEHRCWIGQTQDSVVLVAAETTQVAFSLTRPDVVLGATSLNLVAVNGQRLTVPLSVSNPGDGLLSVTAAAFGSYPNDPWLAVEPSAADIPPGQSFDFEVEIEPDTTDSPGWDYYGRIEIRTNACPDSVLEVAVVVFVVGATEFSSVVPLRTALYPVYPNPFNAATTVVFDLAVPASVELSLFNLNGRRVRSLAAGRLSAGSYRMPLDADDLPSGVYFLSLRTAREAFARKITLIK